jgi:hypothetical protein
MGPKGVSVTATLVHEALNPHDRNAIGVYVNGQRVGYLQRADAERYVKVVDALATRGLSGCCRVDIQPSANPSYAYSIHAYVDTPDRQIKAIAKLEAS